MAEGFFPFSVPREQVGALLEMVRHSAEQAGRDPSSIEVTMESYIPRGDAALADVKSLEAIGATRVLLPAGMFAADPEDGLRRYRDEVIERV
jgi:alkanesulfonate monooxygenase SsuD/methylene tetrahydromethanopterin reductase-like flavin-dependent oxidoreductase (luciferase family)